MNTITAMPPMSFRVRDEAKALLSSVAFTVLFTVVYTALAPIVLLGALLGGPLWAVIVLRRERA